VSLTVVQLIIKKWENVLNLTLPQQDYRVPGESKNGKMFSTSHYPNRTTECQERDISQPIKGTAHTILQMNT